MIKFVAFKLSTSQSQLSKRLYFSHESPSSHDNLGKVFKSLLSRSTPIWCNIFTHGLSSDLLTNQTDPVYRKWETVLMLKAVKVQLFFVHIHVKFDMTDKCQCWYIQYLSWKSTTHSLNTPGTLNWFSVISTKVTESISSTFCSRFIRSLSIRLIIASCYIYSSLHCCVGAGFCMSFMLWELYHQVPRIKTMRKYSTHNYFACYRGF